MKKVFRILLVMLLILPCSVLFACGDNGKDKYDKSAEISNFKTSVAQLKTATGTNFTATVSSTEKDGKETSTDSSVVKVDMTNKVVEYTDDDGTTYITSDRVYTSKNLESDNPSWIVTDTMGLDIFSYLDFSKLTDEEIVKITNVLYNLNSKAIKTTTSGNKKTVSVKIDVAEYVSKLTTYLEQYANKSVGSMIDKIMSDFGVTKTLASSLAEMKEELDDDSTVLDLICFVFNTDIDTIGNILSTPIDSFTGYINDETFGHGSVSTLQDEIDALLADATSSLDTPLDVDTLLNTRLIDLISLIDLPTDSSSSITVKGFIQTISDALYSDLVTVKSVVNMALGSIIGNPQLDYFSNLLSTLKELDIGTISFTVSLETTAEQFTGLRLSVVMNYGEGATKVDKSYDVSLTLSNIGTTSVVLPTENLTIATLIICDADLLSADFSTEDLVIDNVANSLAMQNLDCDVATYDATEKTLTISKEYVSLFLEANSQHPTTSGQLYYNVIALKNKSTAQNEVLVELIFVELYPETT